MLTRSDRIEAVWRQTHAAMTHLAQIRARARRAERMDDEMDVDLALENLATARAHLERILEQVAPAVNFKPGRPRRVA